MIEHQVELVEVVTLHIPVGEFRLRIHIAGSCQAALQNLYYLCFHVVREGNVIGVHPVDQFGSRAGSTGRVVFLLVLRHIVSFFDAHSLPTSYFGKRSPGLHREDALRSVSFHRVSTEGEIAA